MKRGNNPTGLYVVNVYDANGRATGEKFLVRTLKDALGETAARIEEGGFGFTADGYFIFPPFGHVKIVGNDSVSDFRKYRMKAGARKNASIDRARGAKSKLQKMGERMKKTGRYENPKTKGGTRYTDHRGLAFRLVPRGRDTWQIIGASGLGSRVQEENLGTVERRGDGILYVLIPAVGQWWKPTGKTTRAAANYVLENSDEILHSRRNNPGDVHIDIHSHNTRGGGNVRAKNPVKKSGVPPLKDWDITSGGTGIVEKYKAHHWRAENYGTGPSGFREYTIQPIARNGRHAGYVLRVWDANSGGHTTLGTYSSNRDAHYRVREIEARQFGNGPEPRAKNPATVHSKAKGRERMILVLVGHPKGRGYYTGTGWDTTKAKARVFTGRLADVVKAAEKLSVGLPSTYRIEVHAAGK